MAACVAAIFCAAAWLSTAFLAVYARPTPFWWSLLRVLILCAVAGLAALACYKLQPLPRHDRPSLVRRALVAAPVIATLVLFGLSTPSPRLMGEIPTFNGLRFLSLSSLVSPSVPVLCVAAAVMVWGLWRLRQVQLQSAPLRPDSPLPALIWGSHASGGAGVVNELNHPYLHVGARGLALTALPVVVAVALGHRYCYTGEGSAWFGLFLCAGATLVVVLTSFTLAHSLRLGRLLLGGLRALERHPLRLAFGTIHRHGLAWKYSLSPPGTYALAPLVRQADALAYAIRNSREQVLAEAASAAARSKGNSAMGDRNRSTFARSRAGSRALPTPQSSS